MRVRPRSTTGSRPARARTRTVFLLRPSILETSLTVSASRSGGTLVGPPEDGHLLGGPAGPDAHAFPARLLERDAPDRRLRLVLDGRLALGIARPPDPTKPAGPARRPELIVGPGRRGVGVHETRRPVVERLLDLAEHGRHRAREPVLRHECLASLAGCVAAGQDDRALLDVARADLDAKRDAAHLPVVELEAGRDPGALA